MDSGNPHLVVKELGGTGRVHDWVVSLKIREALDIPIYLAGGLNAENVRNAIHQIGPFHQATDMWHNTGSGVNP